MDTVSSDGPLIDAALSGDDGAFGQIVARYEASLFRAAVSRLGRRELAEEAVQDTFLCAHRWLTTYDSQFSFRTWLWTILLNQCARHAKREAKQLALGEKKAVWDMCFGDTGAASPLDQLLARETSESLHELLGQLPEPQADALRLRFFGGLTFPEIAAAMRCSEPGAKNRVKTGLIKLGAALAASEKKTGQPASQQGSTSSLSYESGEVP